MVQNKCVNKMKNKTVSDDLCDLSLKPKELFAKCNENKCPTR